MTLRPDAQREWAYGAYYRAYVLQKDRADVAPSARVLSRLRERMESGEWVVGDDELFRARVERLYGRTLIRLGNPVGRELLVRLYEDTARWECRTDQIDRFLSDLCAELTIIGLHDEAVVTAAALISDSLRPNVLARRLGNLAAWHLQRAVALRVSGRSDEARTDLETAEDLAREALITWKAFNGRRSTATTRLQMREARAIRVSVAVERTALDSADLTEALLELQALLRESLPVPRDETYLQVSYRIGRLGTAHLRRGSVRRGRYYLEHAWRSSGNACVRPWLALDLLEALQTDSDDENAVRAFATEALARLIPQCGNQYPAVEVIRQATA